MKWDNTDLKVGLLVISTVMLAIVSIVWVGHRWKRNIAPLYTDISVSWAALPCCISAATSWALCHPGGEY